MVRGSKETWSCPGAASGTTGHDRRTGRAVWLLFQRHDHQGFRTLVESGAAEPSANSCCHERAFVPLRNVPAHRQSHPARFANHDVGHEMTNMPLPRRDFLKTGGALVIGFSLGDRVFGQEHLSNAAARGASAGPPDAKLIDT